MARKLRRPRLLLPPRAQVSETSGEGSHSLAATQLLITGRNGWAWKNEVAMLIGLCGKDPLIGLRGGSPTLYQSERNPCCRHPVVPSTSPTPMASACLPLPFPPPPSSSSSPLPPPSYSSSSSSSSSRYLLTLYSPPGFPKPQASGFKDCDALPASQRPCVVAPGPWMMLMSQCFKSMPSMPGADQGGTLSAPFLGRETETHMGIKFEATSEAWHEVKRHSKAGDYSP